MLDNFRKQIDEIDNQLIILLEKRFNLAKEIATLKMQKNLPIYDNKREQFIFDKLYSNVFSEELAKVYKTLLETSKEIQLNVKDK